MDVTVGDHNSHKVVANGDVSYLAHLVEIGSNAKASLRIRIQQIGFGAKKAQEPKHVLDMHKLLGTNTGSNKFGSTG